MSGTRVVPLFLVTWFKANKPFGSDKRKTDFQDGCHDGHLGFSIRTILAIFDL